MLTWHSIVGTLMALIDRAVKLYCNIEFSTVWNGAARRSMKIVVRTIGDAFLAGRP